MTNCLEVEAAAEVLVPVLTSETFVKSALWEE